MLLALLIASAQAQCTDDPTYSVGGWTCTSWTGWPCRPGYAGVDSAAAIALLVASCPVACSDVTPVCAPSPPKPPPPPYTTPTNVPTTPGCWHYYPSGCTHSDGQTPYLPGSWHIDPWGPTNGFPGENGCDERARRLGLRCVGSPADVTGLFIASGGVTSSPPPPPPPTLSPPPPPPPPTLSGTPPPPARVNQAPASSCVDDPTYIAGSWTCASWMGWPCRGGGYGVDIALLVASCPVACADVTCGVSVGVPPGAPLPPPPPPPPYTAPPVPLAAAPNECWHYYPTGCPIPAPGLSVGWYQDTWGPANGFAGASGCSSRASSLGSTCGTNDVFAYYVSGVTSPPPPATVASSPPPPASTCVDDPTYLVGGWSCVAWTGFPCRPGYPGVDTPSAIALLVASCPAACADVTCSASVASPPPLSTVSSPPPPPPPVAASPPPPPPPTLAPTTACADDPTYIVGSWTCASWTGWPCRGGGYGVDVALLVASCPVACSDVTCGATTTSSPPPPVVVTASPPPPPPPLTTPPPSPLPYAGYPGTPTSLGCWHLFPSGCTHADATPPYLPNTWHIDPWGPTNGFPGASGCATRANRLGRRCVGGPVPVTPLFIDALPPGTPLPPPPPARVITSGCTDDGTYSSAGWTCTSWTGWPCRSGGYGVDSAAAIALLVASCPVACSDVTPSC